MKTKILFILSLVLLIMSKSYAQDSSTFSETIRKNDTLRVWAGIYDNVNSVPDNDPPGFTQYFGAVSIPLPFYQLDGAKSMWFRNLFIQGTWDTKVQQLNYDSINPQNTHAVNRLDLLQYAYLKATASLNIVTLIIPNPNGKKDMLHLYFDIIGGVLLDSIKANNTIPSSIAGLHLGFKTENISKTPFSIECGADVLWISTRTNLLNANLNPQYRNLNDSGIPLSSLTINNQPYLHLDGQLSYSTSAGNQSYAYIHLAYYDNVFSSSKTYAHNTYVQVQAGYSLDVGSILKKLIPSTSNTGKTSVTANATL
jgi:hypothetical protein